MKSHRTCPACLQGWGRLCIRQPLARDLYIHSPWGEGIWRRVGGVPLPQAQLEEEAKNAGKSQLTLKDLVRAQRRVEGSCT